MSTYFETYYPNGNLEVQLSDNYLGFCVSRSGTIKANFSQGEIYGLELSSTESFVVARTNNDTLIISPACKLASGNTVVYIATYGGTEAQYKVISLSKYTSHNEHDAGIEVYNENGELIFTNTMSVPQFEQNYIANYSYVYTDDRGYAFARNDVNRWQQYTIDDSSNKYIYSIQAPFGLSMPYEASPGGYNTYDYIYVGGYNFSNGKITNLSSSIHPNGYKVTKILGGGDRRHFGVVYYSHEYQVNSYLDYSCGLWCGMYNFSTVLI